MKKINVLFVNELHSFGNLKMDIDNVQCFFENLYKCFGDKIEATILLGITDIDEIVDKIDKTYKEVK